MRILFPFNPLDKSLADGPFEKECEVFDSMGVACSLFDYDSLAFDDFTPMPPIQRGEKVLYRGWMLTPVLYETLVSYVERCGGDMVTSPSQFVSSHHLPGWYQSCKDYTPETIFVHAGEDVIARAREIGWNRYFVKDYVKSNYSDRGSIAESPDEVAEIVELIKEHRGDIEGGIALRRCEQYVADTEKRYFVFSGKVYSPDKVTPDLVRRISEIHSAPFYSVDVIERTDGVVRLVEIGDGQVSDLKSWAVEPFCEMISENAQVP